MSTIRRLSVWLAPTVAVFLFVCRPAAASFADWHVVPGNSNFPTGTYGNWKPYGGTNPNNPNAPTTGITNGISWTIWDGYGPNGNPGAPGTGNAYNFGGQLFDVKAMWSRTDAAGLHVGIVTGTDPQGVRDPVNQSTVIMPGDLAINPNWANNTAALGVLLPHLAAGAKGTTSLVAGGTWWLPNPEYGHTGGDSNYKSGGTVVANDVQYSYTNTGMVYFDDYTRRNLPVYVLEFTIPQNDLASLQNGVGSLAWAPSCYNDSMTVSLNASAIVPEPALAPLVLLGLFAARRRR